MTYCPYFPCKIDITNMRENKKRIKVFKNNYSFVLILLKTEKEFLICVS